MRIRASLLSISLLVSLLVLTSGLATAEDQPSYGPGLFDRADTDETLAALGNPAETLERFFVSLDVGNVPGMTAVVTDDGVLAGFGLCAVTVCAGMPAVEHEMRRLVADQTMRVGPPGAVGVSRHAVTTTVALTSRTIRASRLERIIVNVSAEARRNRLSSLRLDLDLSDEQTASYLAWPPVVPVINASIENNRPVFRLYIVNRSPEPVQVDIRLFLSSGIVQKTWAGSGDRNRGTVQRLETGGQEVGWVHDMVPGGQTWGPFVAQVITDRFGELISRAALTFTGHSMAGEAVSEDLVVTVVGPQTTVIGR